MFLHPQTKVFVAVSIIALLLSLLSYFLLSTATITDDSPEQPENAESPILVTELPMVTDVRLLQPENASSPILVTELGMVMDIRLLQPENAYFPILVTELGMATDVIPEHPLFVAHVDNQRVACNTVEKS